MIKYNPSQIVSIRYNQEKIDEDYQLEQYRSFIEWVLRKPKRMIVRLNTLISTSFIIELENLSENLFIKDNKVWRKANLVFRFSDGSYKTSYFNSNEQAMKCKERVESTNFINL
jgi:hypothetical protein